MKYIAYDDQGIIHIGTKRECQETIRDWSTTEEAEVIYDEDTLGNIWRYFNRTWEGVDNLSFSGFHIDPITDVSFDEDEINEYLETRN